MATNSSTTTNIINNNNNSSTTDNNNITNTNNTTNNNAQQKTPVNASSNPASNPPTTPLVSQLLQLSNSQLFLNLNQMPSPSIPTPTAAIHNPFQYPVANPLLTSGNPLLPAGILIIHYIL